MNQIAQTNSKNLETANQKSRSKMGLIIAVFVNNLSQLPVFIRLGISTYICIAGWALAVFLLLFESGKRINFGKLSMAMILPVGILALSLIFSALTKNSYMMFTQIVFISIMSFALSYMYSQKDSNLDFDSVLYAYVVSAVFVGIVIYATVFFNTGAIYNRQYAYASKNSISHILLSALFICMCMPKSDKKIRNVLRFAVIAFLIVLIAILKSRAAYVGLILGIATIVLSKGINKHVKRLILLGIAVILVLLFVNPTFFDIVINRMIFSNRVSSDLDVISSGRLSIIRSFPDEMKGNYLFGAGSKYFECFPLAALINYGVIFGPILIFVSFLPLIWYEKSKQNMENRERVMYLCILVAYLSDMLFECMAPFGPGAKCYILWMMIGIYFGRQKVTRHCEVL